jgi:hypothetical protein
MLMKKFVGMVIILSFLLGACQTTQVNPTQVQPGSTSTYPAPGEITAIPQPTYPYPVGGEQGAANLLFVPQAGDENLTMETVYPDLQNSEIVLLESDPVQAVLVLRGELPTACHQLRVIVKPDEQNVTQVEVYSVVDPNTICAQVLQPFEVQVPLGSFYSGEYKVNVNGAFFKDFQV